MVRKPAVAGTFYPEGRSELMAELAGMVPEVGEKMDAAGIMVPHAGYAYSGHVAGVVYSRIVPKKTYLVISPNHTGCGARFSFSEEPWDTPLGPVEVDRVLLDEIMKRTDVLKVDPLAHTFEHSLEVQLPFIKYVSPDAEIVPLTVMGGGIEDLEILSDAVTGAIRQTGRDVVVVASTDMTHYEPRAIAREKDRKAIDAVLALDAAGLIKTVEAEDISMCGYIPTAMMILCAKKLGADRTSLIDYSDSGDITGDETQVVGYAGILVYR